MMERLTLTSQQEADALLRAFWDEREQKRREQSNPRTPTFNSRTETTYEGAEQ